MIIFKKSFRVLFLLTLFSSMLFSAKAQAQPVLSDIQGNWAESVIKNLAEKGVINGYPDGAFKPDQNVTRAEFAKLVAKTFGYTATAQTGFPDVREHWAQSYISAAAGQKVMNAFADGAFKPERTVSRAQIATMLSRILHLAKPEEKYPSWSAGFSDVPSGHWAFRYVEIAAKLELFPSNYKPLFQPDQPVTRAEAAWILKALSEVTVTKGKISHIDLNTGLVNIQGNGEPLLAMVVPETVVLRNNAPATIDNLLSGDEVTAIAVPSGDVKFVKAFGRITKTDLLSQISSMTKGKLTPDQISSIVSGDWEAVKDDLKGGLYNQMITMGLTPAEAESIMVQDWNYLDGLSRERLAQAFSGYLGITEDFSQAILARDLAKIKEYGKIELATAALSRLLGVSEPVADNSSL